jgi:hypothetical protein
VNADLSVAPEIARLAVVPVLSSQVSAVPAAQTTGGIAVGLSRLAADPGRWWNLVRFDPDGPARIPVPGVPGAWLVVLPPGATADCDCRYATLLAGEAAESPRPPRPAITQPPATAPAASAPAPAKPLRPGRVRVHGRPAPHTIRGAGHGYSVSLHWTDASARSEEIERFYPERPVAALSPQALPSHPAIPPGE